jgi:hypothetical protein
METRAVWRLGEVIADLRNTTGKLHLGTYGAFICPWCSNDELVHSDDHEHDGCCGDRVWADELPSMPAVLGLLISELPDELLEHLTDFLPDDQPDDLLFADVLLNMPRGGAVIEKLLTDEDEYWPLCRCCGSRGQLVTLLTPMEHAA